MFMPALPFSAAHSKGIPLVSDPTPKTSIRFSLFFIWKRAGS